MPTPADRVPISKRLVFVNSASTVATRLLTVGVFAWAIQHLMKRIPDDEMALLPIALSFSMIFPLLQSILSAGLARHITEAYARDDMKRVTQIVSSQFPLLLAGTLFTLVVGGAMTWWIDCIFTVPAEIAWKLKLMMGLVVVRLALGLALSAFGSGLYANQRFVLINGLNIAGAVLRMLLIVWLIAGIGPQVHYVVIAQVASQLAVQIAMTVLSMRMMPALRYRPCDFSWSVSKEVMTFGLWYLTMQVAQVIRRASDAPLLHLLSTPLAVNTFFFGSFIELRIRDLVLTGVQPLMPALTAMHARGEQHRFKPAFLRGGRIALWVSLAAVTPLVVCCTDIYQLYLGTEFARHDDAITVFLLLVAAFPITYPSLMLNQVAQATGELKEYALLTFYTQVGNLLFTVLLVGGFGMGAVGAALSTLVVALFSNVLLFWPLALRLLNITWKEFFAETLWPGWMPGIASTLVGVGLVQLADISPVWRIVIGMSIAIVVYCVTLIFVMRPADRHDMSSFISATRMRFANSKL